MATKWALVTGAGKRLGLEVARRLGRAGFEIIAHVNGSTTGAEELRAELGAEGRRVHVVRADLASAEGQGALVDAARGLTDRVDALVHNAGIFERVPFESIDRERYARMHAINAEAPFFVTQGLLAELRAAPAPCVVHVTDIAAERPIPGYAHYSMSKASLVMLTRALAVELAPHVRVNAVAPGTVMFPDDFDEETRARFLARIPLRREGSAVDIAAAVAYLVGDAPFVTGQVLAVDGGRSVVL
jgi:pteridine reductase